jgi:S1-C subfamily serine protease
MLFTIGCCVHKHGTTINIHPEGTELAALIQHYNNSSVSLVTKPFLSEYYKTYCGGVWISEFNILTAKHCIENYDKTITIGKEILFRTYSEFTNEVPHENDKIPHKAVIISYDKDSDMAVISSAEDLSHNITKITKVKIPDGTHVLIIGHTDGLQYTCMPGMISHTRRWTNENLGVDDVKVLHITAPMWFGNSGGGVFDYSGNLLGISSFIRTRSRAAFAVHRDVIIKYLNDEDITYYH